MSRLVSLGALCDSHERRIATVHPMEGKAERRLGIATERWQAVYG
jgi:hypothetical protein